jgi:hypothetical protein
MARACGPRDLAEHAEARIIEASDPRYPYVIQHSDYGTRRDNPGMLTGAAGVALALADHAELATSIPTTRWDSILLLS